MRWNAAPWRRSRTGFASCCGSDEWPCGGGNFLRRASSAAVLTLAGCADDRVTPATPEPRARIEILSHYCNWLVKTATRDNWEYTTQRPLSPSPDGYDSFDETVLDYHDELMRRHGIVPLDALGGYGLYEGRFVEEAGGELDEQLLEYVNKVADDCVDHLSRFHPGTAMWLPLQFSYDDSLVEPPRSNPVLRSTLLQAEQLAATWRERIRASEEAAGPETTRVLHVSFNELFEGSGVAPFQYAPGAPGAAGYPEGEEYLRALGEVLNEGA